MGVDGSVAGSDVLCVGEVLWDSLPAGLFLGGAPLNVACHLRALGLSASIASRVGGDRLGEEAIRRIERYGVATDLVQVDGELPTGFVEVSLDGAGVPAYQIVRPAAWDAIEGSDALLARAARSRALVFGSLAQRSELSRGTIQQLCGVSALRVFDVNLRPPYDDREVVRRSLEHADVVKLNEHELSQLGPWFGLPSGGIRETATALAEAFGCPTVCITRGDAGAALLMQGEWIEHAGFRVEVRDTVGAGDAFLAGLLAGLLGGADGRALLRQANLMGAYVASRDGAVPSYDEDAVRQIALRCARREEPGDRRETGGAPGER